MGNVPKSSKKATKLPEKFKDMTDEGLKTAAEELEVLVNAETASIAPKQEELRTLKKYLEEQDLSCKHEKLVRLNDKFFKCEQCQIKVRVRIR